MAYRENKLHEVYKSVAADGPVLSLVESNFHAAGFLPPPEPFEATFRTYLADRFYRPHPQGSPAARRAVAEFDQKRGVATDPERVIITASTSEAYLLIFTTVLEEGKRVLLPAPGYPLFDYLSRQAGVEVMSYPLSPSYGYKLRSRLLPAGGPASRVGAAVIVSPGNPTGHIMDETEQRRLFRLARKHGFPIIVDEVFSDLCYREEGFPVAAKLAAREGVTVFTLNGLSKLLASADMKLGWITVHGPEAERYTEALAFANDLLLGANSYIQHALPDLMEALEPFRNAMREEIRRRREILLEEAAELPGLTLIPAEGGIYATLSIGSAWEAAGYDDEAIAVGLLEEERTYLHPGYFYQGEELGEGEGFLVVTHLAGEERLREGMKRLRRWAEKRGV
ncbi:MAG: pyridoxal phosphate-dependent aminotransferase [Alkalispirochaetaceae bacterium]